MYHEGDAIGPYNIKLLKRLYKNHNKKWVCLFECPLCSASFEAVLNNVSNGDTQSCGCLRKNNLRILGKQSAIDLTNQTFGDLIVIERNGTDNRGYALWKCKCKICNRVFLRNSDQLNHHFNIYCCNKKSNYSKGEEKIASILDNLKIQYIRQYSHPACKNSSSGVRLRFDFYLPEYNCYIEYDGIQHFQPVEYWGGKERLTKQHEIDETKNNFCKNYHAKIVRIPYLDFDKIDEFYLKEKIFND